MNDCVVMKNGFAPLRTSLCENHTHRDTKASDCITLLLLKVVGDLSFPRWLVLPTFDGSLHRRVFVSLAKWLPAVLYLICFFSDVEKL